MIGAMRLGSWPQLGFSDLYKPFAGVAAGIGLASAVGGVYGYMKKPDSNLSGQKAKGLKKNNENGQWEYTAKQKKQNALNSSWWFAKCATGASMVALPLCMVWQRAP